MQCACAILPSVTCHALQHFSTLSHKPHDFRQKVTEHKICIFIFSTTFVGNISHSKKTERNIIINVYRSSIFHARKLPWTSRRAEDEQEDQT